MRMSAGLCPSLTKAAIVAFVAQGVTHFYILTVMHLRSALSFLKCGLPVMATDGAVPCFVGCGAMLSCQCRSVQRPRSSAVSSPIQSDRTMRSVRCFAGSCGSQLLDRLSCSFDASC